MIPFEFQLEFFWYNKALFEQAGVDVPESLDDFPAMCTALREAGITPIALDGQDQWPLERYMAYQPFRDCRPGVRPEAEEGRSRVRRPRTARSRRMAGCARRGRVLPGGLLLDRATPTRRTCSPRARRPMYNIGTWELRSLATDKLDPAVRDDIDFFTLPTHGRLGDGGQRVRLPVGHRHGGERQDVRPARARLPEVRPGAATPRCTPPPARCRRPRTSRPPSRPTPPRCTSRPSTRPTTSGRSMAMPWDTQLDPTTTRGCSRS